MPQKRFKHLLEVLHKKGFVNACKKIDKLRNAAKKELRESRKERKLV